MALNVTATQGPMLSIQAPRALRARHGERNAHSLLLRKVREPFAATDTQIRNGEG
jgi:hypothetical protein